KDIRGIGFATADSVAIRLGMDPHSVERQKAGILFTLERSRTDGHCFLPTQKLLSGAHSLLGFPIHEDTLTLLLRNLEDDGDIVVEEDRVYLTSLSNAEMAVAEFVAHRCEPWEKPLVSEAIALETLRRVQSDLNITFSEEQRSAVIAAMRYPLLILTGGPGCGKTTVTRAIVETFLAAGKVLALTAPTGRAAQRLSQVCNHPAKTIHRLLRFDPFSKKFYHGANAPLEVDGNLVDAVIIDEASMIDLVLAKDLFSAIPKNTACILVGDRDQLPSVGPGKVFGDLISVSKMPTVKLSLLYRRGESSTINEVAHQVNAGIEPSIPEPNGETRADAYFIPRKDPEEAAKTIEKLVSDQIPKKFDISPDDITVLTPPNRGPLGTISLNQRLQDILNPKSEFEDSLSLSGGELSLRIGDRVCQRVNNYQIDELGVFNGDIGHVVEVNSDLGSAVIELWDGRRIFYESENIPQLMLAYAVTVHRSQGSELPCVVLALHESHYTLLERQLIYTAVTRAKKLLVLVGSKRALFLGTKRSGSKTRFCSLTEKIVKLIS
ncbi:MAG: AAA family ATPase, partial [Bdellovibrionales bacterium]|nr:AAA family ATPase [Bdellovibrionales bacterium]